jgi:hypothetical protein
MGEPKGFWSERDREGQDDAPLLATERLHVLRQRPYAELRALADRDTQVEDGSGAVG